MSWNSVSNFFKGALSDFSAGVTFGATGGAFFMGYQSVIIFSIGNIVGGAAGALTGTTEEGLATRAAVTTEQYTTALFDREVASDEWSNVDSARESLTDVQNANLNRFEKKLPSNAANHGVRRTG